MENDVLVIGIAGGTASGKTTLMKNLIGEFGAEVTVLSHDNYYKRHDEMPFEERCKLNYDEPAAFDTSLMVYHLDQLRHGQAIECPVYDFTVHNRSMGRPLNARCTTSPFTTAPAKPSAWCPRRLLLWRAS